jgi:Family of unknown function (DUF5715)
MQRKAATAALMTLAWILVCPGLLLARPTRTPSRPVSRSLAVQPTQHSSRERATHKNAAAHPTPLREAHPAPRRGAHAASRSAANSSSKRRDTAASIPPAAVPAARRIGSRREAVNHDDAPASAYTARRIHAWEQAQRDAAARAAILAADRAASSPRSTRLPADGTATGDEPLAETTSATPNDSNTFGATPDLHRMKSIEEEASTPVLLPPLRVSSLYDSRGRLIVPAPLYGSREILLHQNQMADHDGLDRVRDDADLLDLLREKKLVALPANETLLVDQRLPDNRRYSRPWTAAFLAVLSHDYYSSFHHPLQITSAVRTVAVQQRLVRTNGNAAPVSGDTASPHLTGQAVDIAKHGLSLTEIAWMRTYLGPLIGQGKIDVEEEFQQSCFHISVYKNFLPVVPHVTVAAARQLQPESIPERPNY